MSPRDRKIAAAAISGQTAREIAPIVGVSERQVFRVLARSDVRALIDGAARDAMRAAVASVRAAAAQAAGVLVEIAQDKKAPAATRVAAAGKIMDIAANYELADQERRILELEAALTQHSPNWREGGS